MTGPVQRFVEEMLSRIRREFFRYATNKQFFQERPLLIQAITGPAKYMNERGVKAPASLYRRILQTVIDTIRQKGNRSKIQRFSVYFLHCVQEHMKHHGDEYYYQAKAARPIGSLLPWPATLSAAARACSDFGKATDQAIDQAAAVMPQVH
jgi:hypothetical protein